VVNPRNYYVTKLAELLAKHINSPSIKVTPYGRTAFSIEGTHTQDISGALDEAAQEIYPQAMAKAAGQLAALCEKRHDLGISNQAIRDSMQEAAPTLSTVIQEPQRRSADGAGQTRTRK